MFRTYHRGMVSRSCWSTVQTHPTNDYKTEYTIQRCIEVFLEKGINAVQTLSRCVKECTYLNGAALLIGVTKCPLTVLTYFTVTYDNKYG